MELTIPPGRPDLSPITMLDPIHSIAPLLDAASVPPQQRIFPQQAAVWIIRLPEYQQDSRQQLPHAPRWTCLRQLDRIMPERTSAPEALRAADSTQYWHATSICMP